MVTLFPSFLDEGTSPALTDHFCPPHFRASNARLGGQSWGQVGPVITSMLSKRKRFRIATHAYEGPNGGRDLSSFGGKSPAVDLLLRGWVRISGPEAEKERAELVVATPNPCCGGVWCGSCWSNVVIFGSRGTAKSRETSLASAVKW